MSSNNIWANAQSTLKPKDPPVDPEESSCKSLPVQPGEPEVTVPPVDPVSVTEEKKEDPAPPVMVQASYVDLAQIPVLQWSCLRQFIKNPSSITFNARIAEHMKADPMIKNWIWTAVAIAFHQNRIMMEFPVPDNFCEALGTKPGQLLYVVRKDVGVFGVMS